VVEYLPSKALSSNPSTTHTYTQKLLNILGLLFLSVFRQY
jgi:hypothetical protein